MPYVPPLIPDYDPPKRSTSLGPVPSPEALQAIHDELEAPPPSETPPPDPQPLKTGDPYEKPGPPIPGQPRRRTLVPKISIRDFDFKSTDVAKRLL